MSVLTTADLDQSTEFPVVSGAQKFIIRVPAMQGEPLVYPPAHEKAGQPIVDWEGKPIGDRGIVFLNAKDNAVQAVRTDGNGVIIINQVTQEQAEPLLKSLEEMHRRAGPSLLGYKMVLRHAQKAGLTDMYNSDNGFVAKKMTPAGETAEVGGLYKRDDRDICKAFILQGAGQFQGPGNVPIQTFEDGAVVIQQGENFRLCQNDVFMQTYKHADGAAITPDELQPTGSTYKI